MSVTAYDFDVSVSSAVTRVGAGQPTDGGQAPVVRPLAPGWFSGCSVTGTPRTQAQPPRGAPVAKQARLGPVAIYTHLDSSTTTASAGAAKGPLRRVRDDLWVQNLASGAKRFVFVFWTQPGGHFSAPAGT